ncbi:MAG: alpha-xenorhabdolysin family binary toxin subunit A [Nodularia sp. (in: cyanobacteria)]|nr:alpha-xenorhabdolysin family binary toxin subunit A [Nodularia sp. (in: cyanobacteria)]
MPRTTITEAEIQALNNTGPVYEFVIRDTQIASQLLKIATGQHEDSSPTAGLVLETQAIISIKRYEKKGGSLPKTSGEVHAFLGGDITTPKELNNQAMLCTFLNIRSNSGSWADIERNILKTAVNLDSFANEILTKGDRINKYLEDMILDYSDLMDLDPNLLDDKEYIQKLLESLNADANVAEEQAAKLTIIKALINKLVEKTKDYYDETVDLLDSIFCFQRNLKHCSDDINSKKSLLESLNLSQEIKNKRVQLSQLENRLKDLNTEYSNYIKLAFTGAVVSVIGIIVTGSIFGKKAANTRKEIAKVEEDIRKIEQELQQLNRRVSAVSILDLTFIGLFTVMNDAEKGVNQIVQVWQTIEAFLKNSYNECGKINEAKDLLDFWISFIGVVDPWNTVQNNAALVTQRFNEALDQWARENS